MNKLIQDLVPIAGNEYIFSFSHNISKILFTEKDSSIQWEFDHFLESRKFVRLCFEDQSQQFKKLKKRYISKKVKITAIFYFQGLCSKRKSIKTPEKSDFTEDSLEHDRPLRMSFPMKKKLNRNSEHKIKMLVNIF